MEKKAMVSDGYSVVQQGDLKKKAMVSDGNSLSRPVRVWKMPWSLLVTQSSRHIWKRRPWPVMVTQLSSRHI